MKVSVTHRKLMDAGDNLIREMKDLNTIINKDVGINPRYRKKSMTGLLDSLMRIRIERNFATFCRIFECEQL